MVRIQGRVIKKLQVIAVWFAMVEGDGCSHNVVSKIHFKSMSAVQRAKEPTFNDGSNQGKVIKKLQVIAVDLRWWREMDSNHRKRR